MTHIRTRYLATYCDGFRLLRRFYILRAGRGRRVGLGVILDRETRPKLTVTLGPWSLSVDASTCYRREMTLREIAETEAEGG